MPSSNRKNTYTGHNKVQIVRGGSDYFDKIEQIADAASYSLHLQTYIFDEDETGKRVAAALIRAAGRGVAVYMLLDGYASQDLSRSFIGDLKKSGIHFDFFEPLLKSSHFYFGRRLHHKLVVADAATAMVAGINISNRYNDMDGQRAWLDWAICVEGEAAAQLDEVCRKVWNGSVFRAKCEQIAVLKSPILPNEICLVRVRRNDWVHRRTEITKTYRELFANARREVVIMTSYFGPPQKLLKRITAAARRGVKIKLILTARADVPLAKYAERHLYARLLQSNIELYEYQPNILHGKIAVCDGELLTVGSYNVNNISAFASVELNLDIKDESIASQVTTMLQHIADTDCKRITNDDFLSAHGTVKRLLYYLSYRIVHFIFFLFTFYFIQRRENE